MHCTLCKAPIDRCGAIECICIASGCNVELRACEACTKEIMGEHVRTQFGENLVYSALATRHGCGGPA